MIDAVYTRADLNLSDSQDLEVILKGSTVSVSLRGELVLSHAFNALVTDGDYGLIGTGGQTEFDEVTFQTDDPVYESISQDDSTISPVTSKQPLLGPIAPYQGDDISLTLEAWPVPQLNGGYRTLSSTTVLAPIDTSFAGLLLYTHRCGPSSGNPVTTRTGTPPPRYRFTDCNPPPIRLQSR